MKPLEHSFYLRDALEVAQALIGKILVREIKGERYLFRIIETEAYRGIADKASHAYGGKHTKRTAPMFKEGGITYIYLIYGMHYCLNIVTEKADVPHAVLIRALEPLEDKAFQFAAENRKIKSKSLYELTNGPGKLCKALAIDKTLNEQDITGRGPLWIADQGEVPEITKDKRINIPYAMEFKEVEWRFYRTKSPFVSVEKKL